jgi:hypothetical protein
LLVTISLSVFCWSIDNVKAGVDDWARAVAAAKTKAINPAKNAFIKAVSLVGTREERGRYGQRPTRY